MAASSADELPRLVAELGDALSGEVLAEGFVDLGEGGDGPVGGLGRIGILPGRPLDHTILGLGAPGAVGVGTHGFSGGRSLSDTSSSVTPSNCSDPALWSSSASALVSVMSCSFPLRY